MYPVIQIKVGDKVTLRLPDNTVKTIGTPRLDCASVKVGQNVIIMRKSEQPILVSGRGGRSWDSGKR